MTNPDVAKFRDAMDAAIDKYVKQQARNTIALNAKRDPACAGYARIPGPDACDFCVTMGAANDFYHTEKTAGSGELHGTADDHYHPYCNCRVCLVFRRGGKAGGDLVARDPQTGEAVPYDPADMLHRYEEAGCPTFSKRGAVSGAVRGDAAKELEHAESFYEQVRNRDRESVLKSLGRASGLDPDEMERAFNHLLIEEHPLNDGVHRFVPDYEISQSMQRLLSGKRIQKHDRLLFAHENLESVYMEQGFDQRTAHQLANLKYNYQRSLDEWLAAGAKV